MCVLDTEPRSSARITSVLDTLSHLSSPVLVIVLNTKFILSEICRKEIFSPKKKKKIILKLKPVSIQLPRIFIYNFMILIPTGNM